MWSGISLWFCLFSLVFVVFPLQLMLLVSFLMLIFYCISFEEMSIQIFAYVFSQQFNVLLSCRRFLIYSISSCLSGLWFSGFSPFCGCSFHCLIRSLKHKNFDFHEVLFLHLFDYCVKLLPKLRSWRFALMFAKSLIVLTLTSGLDPFQVSVTYDVR